jgi:hypothetical protein
MEDTMDNTIYSSFWVDTLIIPTLNELRNDPFQDL